MAKGGPPCFGLFRLGREWVPTVWFTCNRDRAEFVRLADWLCREFGAEVVRRYGGSGPKDKEYWTLRVGGTDWLLMRCFYPAGISLDGRRPGDLPAFEAIALAVGVTPVGWRYRWMRLVRRLRGGTR